MPGARLVVLGRRRTERVRAAGDLGDSVALLVAVLQQGAAPGPIRRRRDCRKGAQAESKVPGKLAQRVARAGGVMPEATAQADSTQWVFPCCGGTDPVMPFAGQIPGQSTGRGVLDIPVGRIGRCLDPTDTSGSGRLHGSGGRRVNSSQLACRRRSVPAALAAARNPDEDGRDDSPKCWCGMRRSRP